MKGFAGVNNSIHTSAFFGLCCFQQFLESAEGHTLHPQAASLLEQKSDSFQEPGSLSKQLLKLFHLWLLAGAGGSLTFVFSSEVASIQKLVIYLINNLYDRD